MKRFILLVLIGFVLTSCQEEVVDEYFVKVKVVNENGVPIQNAAVKMFAPVAGATEWYEEATDPSGEVVFRTGRYAENPAREAYYDLKAWKMIYEGCNYVRLVKGETVEVNVVIYPIGEPNGCVE